MNPKEFDIYIKNEEIYYLFYETPAGILTILSTNKGIFDASYGTNKIQANYKIHNNLELKKLLLVGTNFQIKVWLETLKIKQGQISTYAGMAQSIGNAKSYRAIGNALGKNKIAFFVPCHRILKKDGKIGGYKWGINIKEKLLKKERKSVSNS